MDAGTITIRNDQSLPITAVVQVDSTGTPLTIPDSGYSHPVWTYSDPTLGSISGVTGNFNPSGKPGTLILTATESKSGSPDLVGTATIIITGPVPASLSLTFGTPTP